MLRGRQAVRAYICLPCRRCVAGLRETLFRGLELSLELLELSGFRCEGLLPAGGRVSKLSIVRLAQIMTHTAPAKPGKGRWIQGYLR